VSSSGHLALVTRLLGWDYADLPPEARKAFEVALHVASVPALALALRGRGRGDLRLLPLTLLPPAVAGLALERPIERRLGGARSVAAAQVAAGIALWLADRRPERRSSADVRDHLAVGLAQAAALVPGVSRSGAALTVARARGLSRDEAWGLALRAALPVTAGAGLLKGVRLVRERAPGPSVVGAAAAFASSLAALPLAGTTRLGVVAAYRVALGLGALSVERGRRRKLVSRLLAAL
jgi:undecaprenyl-diphosphatase